MLRCVAYVPLNNFTVRTVPKAALMMAFTMASGTPTMRMSSTMEPTRCHQRAKGAPKDVS